MLAEKETTMANDKNTNTTVEELRAAALDTLLRTLRESDYGEPALALDVLRLVGAEDKQDK